MSSPAVAAHGRGKASSCSPSKTKKSLDPRNKNPMIVLGTTKALGAVDIPKTASAGTVGTAKSTYFAVTMKNASKPVVLKSKRATPFGKTDRTASESVTSATSKSLTSVTSKSLTSATTDSGGIKPSKITPVSKTGCTPDSAPSSNRISSAKKHRYEELTIRLKKHVGETLGVMVGDALTIERITLGTPADGKLEIGDRVLRVNGIQIKDLDHFSDLVVRAGPEAVIVVLRETDAMLAVPPPSVPADRAKLCHFRNGFTYKIIRVDVKQKMNRLGFVLKDCPKGILVSRIDKDSVAAGRLQVGDRLVDVNSLPITTTDHGRQMMLRSLIVNRFFTSLVERAESANAKREIGTVLQRNFDFSHSSHSSHSQIDKMKDSRASAEPLKDFAFPNRNIASQESMTKNMSASH